MATFDVESLFTNIPLDETICANLKYQNSDIVDNICKEDFRTFLTLATKESFFLFDNEYYKQVDGVAMGSPLGPTLANIFMSFHEKNWLNNCPPSFQPKLYRR